MLRAHNIHAAAPNPFPLLTPSNERMRCFAALSLSLWSGRLHYAPYPESPLSIIQLAYVPAALFDTRKNVCTSCLRHFSIGKCHSNTIAQIDPPRRARVQYARLPWPANLCSSSWWQPCCLSRRRWLSNDHATFQELQWNILHKFSFRFLISRSFSDAYISKLIRDLYENKWYEIRTTNFLQ